MRYTSGGSAVEELRQAAEMVGLKSATPTTAVRLEDGKRLGDTHPG